MTKNATSNLKESLSSWCFKEFCAMITCAVMLIEKTKRSKKSSNQREEEELERSNTVGDVC